jgi:hypothetical protein
MRSILFVNLLSLLLFNACTNEQKSTPKLEGDWIQAGQYIIGDQDTIWQRQAVIWDLQADSNGRVLQFQLQEKLKPSIQAIRWQVENGKLKLETASTTEHWLIIKHTEDSLIVELPPDPNIPQKIYWLFRKMDVKPSAEVSSKINQFLNENIFELESTTYQNSTPLQWEAIGHHFIHPNLPQSWYLPLRWGQINYKGINLIALQAILSGQLNQWEFLEVNHFDETTIEGRFFKEGKLQQLVFKPMDVQSAFDIKKLEGNWMGDNGIKILQFKSEDQYLLKSTTENLEGTYYPSKHTPIVYLQNGFQFQYLKIDTLTDTSFEAELYSTQNRRQKIQFTKTKNAQ